jgi:hypothetical protein
MESLSIVFWRSSLPSITRSLSAIQFTSFIS